MNKEILQIEIPDDIYINRELLDDMVIYGLENYSLPEEVLAYFGFSPRYFQYWCKLEKIGDRKAAYIVDRLEMMHMQWMNEVRTKVLKSIDTKSISNLVIYLQERHDQRQSIFVDDVYSDNWVD